MKKLKIAILGYGGIARLHYAAYRRLMDEGIPVDVVAVCEKNKDSVFKNVSITLGAAIRGEKCVDNTPESSMMSVKTIEAIKASANMCGEKIKINF